MTAPYLPTHTVTTRLEIKLPRRNRHDPEPTYSVPFAVEVPTPIQVLKRLMYNPAHGLSAKQLLAKVEACEYEIVTKRVMTSTFLALLTKLRRMGINREAMVEIICIVAGTNLTAGRAIYAEWEVLMQ